MSHRSQVSALAISQDRPDSEVLAKPERRRFTAEYKLRILQEAEQCAHRVLLVWFGDHSGKLTMALFTSPYLHHSMRHYPLSGCVGAWTLIRRALPTTDRPRVCTSGPDGEPGGLR